MCVCVCVFVCVTSSRSGRGPPVVWEGANDGQLWGVFVAMPTRPRVLSASLTELPVPDSQQPGQWGAATQSSGPWVRLQKVPKPFKIILRVFDINSLVFFPSSFFLVFLEGLCAVLWVYVKPMFDINCKKKKKKGHKNSINLIFKQTWGLVFDIFALSGSSDYSVPLEGVSETQLTLCHPERELLPLVLAHCHYTLRKGRAADCSYNLRGIQAQLARSHVTGKPLIKAVRNRNKFINSKLNTFPGHN